MRLPPLSLLAAAALAACAGSPRPAGAPAPVRTALTRYVDSLVNAPEFRNAHWGVLIVDPDAGDTLYAHNADKLFMPASNMKIITGSVALTRLGPDYRFATTYAAMGPVRDSTLHGNLVVMGTGDPSVSLAMHPDDALAPLRAVADSLRAHGIARIDGAVVAGGDAFPDAAYGYGWAWDDFDYPYSAGVDELFLNEGFATIAVRGGAQPGDAATLRVGPVAAYPEVVNAVRTVPPDEIAAGGPRRRARLRVGMDSATGRVLVSGTIAPGDSAVEEIAYRDQRAAFLAGLAEALASRGIAVSGSPALSDSTDSLFTMMSPTLREIMPVLEKPSQNQIAEIFYKTLGREGTGVGSADSARRVVQRQLAAWGVDSMGHAIRDGSGLSRHDYLTPRTIVQVLSVMRHDPNFSVFYDALPIAGVDGTIASRMKGTPAEGNLHAKTGTLDKARSLSGYVRTADGRTLVFSALCNNYTVPTAEATRVQDLIGAYLAGLRIGGGQAATGGGGR